jgi:putative phosphoesterase
MRVGILSDIHGNAHALTAVLNSAREKRVERLLCCGDYVGYYHQPAEVLKLLDGWKWDGTGGNHEDMLRKWGRDIDREEIRRKYGSGIAVAWESLGHAACSYLTELPHQKRLTVDGQRVLLCHGSPWNRDYYVYPDANPEIVNQVFEHDLDFDLLAYGHTHHQVKWVRGEQTVINPGSVGQPRDRKPGAAWAVWDTSTNEIELFTERYDPNPVIEICKKNDPGLSYLVDVLLRK